MTEYPSIVITVLRCGHCPFARWRARHSTCSGGWCSQTGSEIHNEHVVMEGCPIRKGVIVVRLAETQTSERDKAETST